MVNAERSCDRLRAGLGWSVLALLLVSSCGNNESASSQDEAERIAFAKKARLPGVLAVGGETISWDQMARTVVEGSKPVLLIEYLRPLAQASDLAQFKGLARPKFEEILTVRMRGILLYQKAKSHFGEKTDELMERAMDAEWRRFVLRFGGDEASAEEGLRRMGMTRQSFREQRTRLILRESYIALKLGGYRPISHRELVKCYDEMKEEYFAIQPMLKFRLIDIQPGKLDIEQADMDQLERARELAEKLVERLKQDEDFGELAKQYSHGHRSLFGGLWDPVHPESLAEPYDILATEAEKIEPSQISEPIEVEGHIFIMKLEERRSEGYEPLEEVQREVERKIIIDRQKEAIDKLNAEMSQQVALGQKDEFIDFCLERIYESIRQKGQE